MCDLAFVPPAEVPHIFDKWHDEAPDSFMSIANYFEATYIRGVAARGRRRAMPVMRPFYGTNMIPCFKILPAQTMPRKDGTTDSNY